MVFTNWVPNLFSETTTISHSGFDKSTHYTLKISSYLARQWWLHTLQFQEMINHIESGDFSRDVRGPFCFPKTQNETHQWRVKYSLGKNIPTVERVSLSPVHGFCRFILRFTKPHLLLLQFLKFFWLRYTLQNKINCCSGWNCKGNIYYIQKTK